LLGPGNCTQLIFLPKESQRRCSPKQTSGLSAVPARTVQSRQCDGWPP
jgi:hypothetical protein